MQALQRREDFHSHSDQALSNASTQPPCTCPQLSPVSKNTSVSREVKDAPPTITFLSWTGRSMSDPDPNKAWFRDTGPHSMAYCYKNNYLPASMKCEYVHNRRYLNISDAVLFRARLLMSKEYMPERTPNQKWIIWEFEPPYKTWYKVNLTAYNGMFNLTALYTRDSDIPIFNWKHCIRNQDKLQQLSQVDYVHKKNRSAPVAWFVSVCHSQSKRERYVKDLQKYIEVDIWGYCGQLRCGSNRPGHWAQENCEVNLFHNNGSYKFYLAFENSFCKDYITEKLWKVMDLDIVPVVMGLADYSSILPKDSYIDVADFKSAKELADYLHLLDRDHALYNQYIRNKRSLECQELSPMPVQCRICQRLHELRGQTRVIHDLASYWGSKRCITPERFHSRPANDDFQMQ